MKILISILMAMGIACGTPAVRNVSVDEFASIIEKGDVQLLDVRTPEEFAAGHIAGALLADYNGANFTKDARKVLKKGVPVAIYCRSGRRSAAAAEILVKEGFTVYNLEGGILSWIDAGKKTEI